MKPNAQISALMHEINLARIDLNLLVTFEALMDLRSVALAADRMGRTPSAVSHALARLREQVGDPLLVKVAGRMQPSPFALQLIADVRPILRSIHLAQHPARHLATAALRSRHQHTDISRGHPCHRAADGCRFRADQPRGPASQP